MSESLITLGLLVKNEVVGCKMDIPTINRSAFLEIIAIDGGSTDGTVEYLKSQNIPVFRQSKESLNAAYHDLNRLAKGKFVISFFPKGTLPVEDLYKFERYFLSGKNLVIASRKLPGAVNEEDKNLIKIRKWGVGVLSIVAAYLWRREGDKIKDVLHGFKGWTKSSFDEMQLNQVGVTIDIEMVVRSYRLGISRIEFPTTEKQRTYGETNFKIWPTGKKILKYLYSEIQR